MVRLYIACRRFYSCCDRLWGLAPCPSTLFQCRWIKCRGTSNHDKNCLSPNPLVFCTLMANILCGQSGVGDSDHSAQCNYATIPYMDINRRTDGYCTANANAYAAAYYPGNS